MTSSGMTLGEVLSGVTLRTALQRDLAARAVEGIEYDSRRVGKDFLFFAFAGARAESRQAARF